MLSPAPGGKVGTESRPDPREAPPGLWVADAQTPLLVEPVGLGSLAEEGAEVGQQCLRQRGRSAHWGLWLCPGTPLPCSCVLPASVQISLGS